MVACDSGNIRQIDEVLLVPSPCLTTQQTPTNMTTAYHYHLQSITLDVKHAENPDLREYGAPERIDIVSEYYFDLSEAITRLNNNLTSLKGQDGNPYPAAPIDEIENDVETSGQFGYHTDIIIDSYHQLLIRRIKIH